MSSMKTCIRSGVVAPECGTSNSMVRSSSCGRAAMMRQTAVERIARDRGLKRSAREPLGFAGDSVVEGGFDRAGDGIAVEFAFVLSDATRVLGTGLDFEGELAVIVDNT